MATRLHSAQRHELILKTVKEKRVVTVPDMAARCGTSEMTIRRDFDRLEKRGILVRTHGGAMLPGVLTGVTVDLVEPSLDHRAQQNRQAKMAMARLATDMIEPSKVIALDIGTSTFELALRLENVPVTVFTTSLKIASLLSSWRPRVYVPSGEINGAEPSIVGARAAEDLGRLLFDVAFVGISGLSVDGLYDYSLEDAEMKKAMIAQSQKTVVLLDSSKFDRKSVARVSDLDAVDILITEKTPPMPIKEALEAANVEIRVADAA